MCASQMRWNALAAVRDGYRDAMCSFLRKTMSSHERPVNRICVLENVPKQLANAELYGSQTVGIMLQVEHGRDVRYRRSRVFLVSNLRERQKAARLFVLLDTRIEVNTQMLEEFHASGVRRVLSEILDTERVIRSTAPRSPRCDHRQRKRFHVCPLWMKSQHGLIAILEVMVALEEGAGGVDIGVRRNDELGHTFR